MTAKKSFFFILRIVFVVFSLQFIKDAFFKWDGYSFYMTFFDFLPEVSLSFILWTVLGLLFSVTLWIVVYGIYMLSPKRLIEDRFEHVMAWIILIVLAVYIKRTSFSGFAFSHFLGLGYKETLILGGIVATAAIWILRNHLENILYGFNARITPLIWLFGVFLILAVPMSFLNEVPSTEIYEPEEIITVSSTGKKPPNIILVSWDALTALDMQVYGYERPTTPFLSEWAKDAVMFQNVYAASNWTGPTSMSMMTGQRVWTHKAWYRTKYHPVRNNRENFPRVLREYGYDTYSFIQNLYAHPETLGIEEDFLVRDKTITFFIPVDWWFSKLTDWFEPRTIVQEWIFKNSAFAQMVNRYHPDVNFNVFPSTKIYDRFLEHITSEQSGSSGGNKPFFAWLHIFQPHQPYLPPEKVMSTFGDTGKYDSHKKQYRNFNFNAAYKPEKQNEVDILRKRYDEFILHSDNQLKSFLEKLPEIIDMSNTIVIFTSDHGESFTHEWLAHDEHPLYEALVRIPLIIKIPENSLTGKIVEMPVEQTDLAPTILDMAGIPIPEWMDGRSLLPLLKGKTIEPEPVLSMQLIKNRSFGHPITKGTVAVRDRDYKLIHYIDEQKSMLFDLKSDPGETRNIFDENPEIAGQLLRHINESVASANLKIQQSAE